MLMTSPIHWPALENAVVTAKPYPHTIITDFIDPAWQADLVKDFPDIRQDGSFPLSAFQLKASMQPLITALESEALRQWIAKKFDIDLSKRPTTITLRGYCTKGRDGKIHTDSKDKLITVLLYLGGDWQEGDSAGCLRILNHAKDLSDYAAQVPPRFGTCVMFKVTDNGWHGFEAFAGVRRAIQLNYVVSTRAASKNIWRHKLAALVKKFI